VLLVLCVWSELLPVGKDNWDSPLTAKNEVPPSISGTENGRKRWWNSYIARSSAIIDDRCFRLVMLYSIWTFHNINKLSILKV
jgi:hypothetical protein